jgi:hypothetical protein
MADLVRRHPSVRFTGPAAIDFEYPAVLASLRRMPDGVRLWGLSHHLYVDRRGAPENRQGRFAALEKFALARAIARFCPDCDERLIVSEVNWPLLGTGVYSPVGSPYVSPGERRNDPSVSEDDYADFMVRYLLIALCSGLVERVVWWQLAAHGYGLIDDRGDSGWRRRPAFHAMRAFVTTMEDATFTGLSPTVGEAGMHVLMFESEAGAPFCVAYREQGHALFTPPFRPSRAFDATGAPVPVTPEGSVPVTPRPVYVFS